MKDTQMLFANTNARSTNESSALTVLATTVYQGNSLISEPTAHNGGRRYWDGSLAEGLLGAQRENHTVAHTQPTNQPPLRTGMDGES